MSLLAWIILGPWRGGRGSAVGFVLCAVELELETHAYTKSGE
jgi:hypothetical protein